MYKVFELCAKSKVLFIISTLILALSSEVLGKILTEDELGNASLIRLGLGSALFLISGGILLYVATFLDDIWRDGGTFSSALRVFQGTLSTFAAASIALFACSVMVIISPR